MPAQFEYILKASVSLAFVYLFYLLLLKRMTFYVLNRFFLLLYSILAFVVPLVSVNTLVGSSFLNEISFNKMSVLQIVTKTTNANSNLYGFDVWKVVSVIFVTGCTVMFIRFIVQLISLKKLQSKATLLHANSFKLYHLPSDILPFSFLNSIYLNKDNYSKAELAEIIKHEQVHVQQRHTIDMLIAEVICILNWYNPFAWLIKKAVQENLEFIADEAVIRKGIDKKSYQYLLLKVTGQSPLAITMGLKFSGLKSRVFMMNKTRTKKFHLLKFAMLVPLLTIVLLAFRNKRETFTDQPKEQNTITKKYILSSLTYSIPDQKAAEAVKKEQNKCLLKTGEALNLELIFSEKTRLKNLLQATGFNNMGEHAITFMIDTTLGNNSFSILVNINTEKSQVSEGRKGFHSKNKLDTSADSPINSMSETEANKKPGFVNVATEKSEDRGTYQANLNHSNTTAVH